ncbi:MAG: hypothetical protein KGN77_02025 [Xanthomonadaceae bacterium]|nr:hypothetical protein [Xanthomonadaceae bacterium]
MVWPKGRRHTDETRRKISAATVAAMANPVVLARLSAASNAAWANPVVRERMLTASRSASADPKNRARMSEAQRRRYGWGEADEKAAVEHAGMAFDGVLATPRAIAISASAWGTAATLDAVNAHRRANGEDVFVLADRKAER